MNLRLSKSHALWIVLTLFLVFAGAYHGSVLPILVIELGSFFRVSTILVGLLLSSASIGTMLAGGVAGPMIDYYGARKVLIASIAGLSIALLSSGGAPSFAIYFIAAIAIAMTYNAMSMAIPLYIIALNPKWQRKGFALNLVTGVVPGLFFPYLTERLIATNSISFESVLRAPYISIGVLCVVLFIVFAARSPTVGGAGKQEASFFSGLKNRVAPVFRRRRTWLFVLLSVLHGTADSTIYQWFPTYLVHRFDNLVIGPGLTMSLFSLSYFLSRVIIVLLPEHVGRRVLVVIPGLLGGALMCVSLFTGNSTTASLFYIAAAFCWSFEFPAMFSEAFRETKIGFGSFQSVALLITSGITFVIVNSFGIAVDSGVRLEVLLAATALLFIVFGAVCFFGRIGDHSAVPDS